MKLLANLNPLLLSHHPNCEKYKDHTFLLGKYRFCIGCFIGYPSSFLVFIIGIFVFPRYLLLSKISLYLALVGFSTIFLNLFQIFEKKKKKIFHKLLLGASVGIILSYQFVNNSFFDINRYLGLFLSTNVLFIPIMLIHGLKMNKICDNCLISEDPLNCEERMKFQNRKKKIIKK